VRKNLGYSFSLIFYTMTRKAKSRQEIARDYGISARTLTRWIHRGGLNIPKGPISPRNQDLIYEKFGKPQLFVV
jgi:transposase-like protein